jgi:cyclopropane fatty-acyl-phospholipid synthase-like methyltransferase
MSAWAYRAKRPELSAAFDRTMADHRTRAGRAVLSAYDLSQARTIVDVGGGRGGLIAELLAALPHVHGVVFDQPHVVASAAEVLRAAGVTDRASIVGGSFFDAVPSGGDTYILQYVLHDWSDERCIALLRRCRAAMDARARLLIIENLVPARADPTDQVVMLDLHMMVMLGGRERTRDEFGALLRAAGFELVATLPTHGAGYILVAALARDEGPPAA